MGRLPRIYIEGAVYYVTCRGAQNEKLFREEKDYKMYLELLEKYKEEYNFKLFAYCLLPHHLHLLIEPKKETKISQIMRNLNTAYSKYFNSRYNRQGHLFRERFKACLVEKEPYLLKVISYLHLNPVRLKIVNHPVRYPYCSFYLYNNYSNPPQEVREVLGYLEGASYLDYIEGTKDLDLHKQLQRGGIFGSKEFIKKVKEEIQKEKKTLKKKKSKRNIFLGAGVSLVLLTLGIIWWWNFIKEKEERKEKIVTPIKEIRELDNTEWRVQFISLESNEKVFVDTLSFVKGKFISAKFSQEGFKSSNYSVTQEKDKIIWETIQTKEDETLSWRGEIINDKMQGVLSLRNQEGAQDFSFISMEYRRKK
jgi:REP element-mobilizing transposase RayT